MGATGNGDQKSGRSVWQRLDRAVTSRAGKITLVSILALGIVGSLVLSVWYSPTLINAAIRTVNADERAKDREDLKTLWRFYEMTVAFTAEGRKFKVSATFVCKPYFTYPGGSRLLQYKRAYWLGKRLPSGAGVMFESPPRLCKRGLVPGGKASEPLRFAIPYTRRFLPRTLWLDRAEDPTVLEAYISETYYEGPSPRLRIHSVSVRPLASGKQTDIRDEIPWLKTYKIHRPETFGKFVGFYSTVVRKSVWSQEPDVASVLREVHMPTVFPRETHIHISRKISTWYVGGPTTIGSGKGVPRLGEPLPPSYTRRQHTANRRVHPFRLKNNRYVLSTKESGLIVYYRGVVAKKHIEVWIGERPIPTRLSRRWQFDPRTQLLFTVNYGQL